MNTRSMVKDSLESSKRPRFGFSGTIPLRLALVLFVVPSASLPIANDDVALVRQWLPTGIGDRWTYEEQILSGKPADPKVIRWKIEETTVTLDTIPEGVLVRRKVRIVGQAAPPPSVSMGSESNILIRRNCIYYLNESASAGSGYPLAEFRQHLANGDALPDVCFPLRIGQTWGNPQKGRDLWRVAGSGPRRNSDPSTATTDSWRLEAHLSSGDDNDVWFKRGVGIVARRTFHNGTYQDQKTRLIGFQPAAPKSPL